MKNVGMSRIVKSMAQQIIRRNDSSAETINIAINIVHIAWNFADEDYKDEPGYILGIKEMQERLAPVKDRLVSGNVEEMTEKLMRHKLQKYPDDKRIIYACDYKNGKLRVASR